MDRVRISVAMATYNGEMFLRKQLDSLYAQTLLPFEVVVVDDKSTDGTAAILQDYSLRYGLKYYVNEETLGVNRNFEKAISKCSGDYIIICDQDDIWFSNKIEVSLKKLMEIGEDKPALVSSQCLHIDANDNIISKSRTIVEGAAYTDTVLLQGRSQGCTLMFNKKLKDILLDFPPQKPLYDVYISLVAACVGIKYNLSEPLMYYRHHNNNVVAKIVPHRNIKTRINSFKDSLMKVDVIPDERFTSIQLVLSQYSTLIIPTVRQLLEQLIKYKMERGLIKRLLILCSIHNLKISSFFKGFIHSLILQFKK